MIYVNVKIAKDSATSAQKKRIVEEIAETLTSVLDKKPEHIHIVIDEIKPENWVFAGMPTTEYRELNEKHFSPDRQK